MKLIPLLLTSGLLTTGFLISSVDVAAAKGNNNKPASNTSTTTTTTTTTTTSQPASQPVAETSSSPKCTSAGFAFTSCIGGFDLGSGENDVTDGAADNLASQKLASGVFDGITDWLFNSKINVGGGETTGAGKGDALGFDLSYNQSATTGQFTFGNIDLATTNLAISMKSAKSYSVFYFKAGSLLSSVINWDMFGVSTNKQGIAQGLSHASVYYSKLPTPVIPPVTPAPAPAPEAPKVENPVVSEPAPAPEAPKVENPVVSEPAPAPAPEAPKVENPVVSEPAPAPAPEAPKIEVPTEVLTAEPPASQPVTEVPEPASLLGLAAVVGLGTQLKRRLSSN